MRSDCVFRRRVRAWAKRATAAACVLALLAGCSYPQVGQPTYEMTVALDQALERRDPAQLTRAREILDAQLEAGEMTAEEHAMLAQIIATAERGDWAEARAEIRLVLEDQVDW